MQKNYVLARTIHYYNQTLKALDEGVGEDQAITLDTCLPTTQVIHALDYAMAWQNGTQML